ncbi:MAG TPA: hypothetical protein VGO39_08200 [Gaiellaceae bacterium]|jgi:hypothetical protein|nr:hypothetical protein [Gaiellaceae bacterium]
MLVLAAAASAAATRVVPWEMRARGVATKDDGAAPLGILASSKLAAKRLVRRMPRRDGRMVLALDYRRLVALGVFGRFGCRDARVRIARIERAASLLRVRLVMEPLASGKVECLAIYPTFRLVAIDRSDLGPGLPTHVVVRVAGA